MTQNFWVNPSPKLIDEVLRNIGKKNVDYYVDDMRRAYILPNETIKGKWLMVDTILAKKWPRMDTVECYRRVLSYTSRRYRDYRKDHPLPH